MGRYCNNQAPLRLAIYDIDPECDDIEDLDMQFLIKNRNARMRCDLCPIEIANKCDLVHCCMDPNYSGWC